MSNISSKNIGQEINPNIFKGLLNIFLGLILLLIIWARYNPNIFKGLPNITLCQILIPNILANIQPRYTSKYNPSPDITFKYIGQNIAQISSNDFQIYIPGPGNTGPVLLPIIKPMHYRVRGPIRFLKGRKKGQK